MKKYNVTVCWTISKTVTVDAEDAEQAHDLAFEDIGQPMALMDGRNDSYMDVSEAYVPDEDWALEEVEIGALERPVERLDSYSRSLEDYRRIHQAIANGDHHQPKP